MKYVKKIFGIIVVFFSGVIATIIANILRDRRSTDRMGTIPRRTRECKEQLERDSETVRDVGERQRYLIREIRNQQKLEQ